MEQVIIQCNLGRRKASLDEMYQLLIQNNNIICAVVQEPYTIANKIPCPSSFMCIACSPESGRARAAIIIPSHLKTIHLQQYSTTDICSCVIYFKDLSFNVTSVYLPTHNMQHTLSDYLNILTSISSQYKNAIILGDFNSHNVIWGSTHTDPRGNEISEFIASNDLYILNQGHNPTFHTFRDATEYSSCIDLSLCSSSMLSKIQNWKLSSKIATSDHLAITITLNNLPKQDVSSSTRRWITNIPDWTKFNLLVNRYRSNWLNAVSQIRTKHEVDRVANIIFSDLSVICERSLPKKKNLIHTSNWWTHELTELRKTAKRWKKRLNRVRSPYLRRVYFTIWSQHHKEYVKAIASAKCLSWKNFLTNQTKETAWTKAYRLCRNFKLKPPSTIQKSDGSYTTDAQETAEHLLECFAPNDDDNTDNQHIQIMERENEQRYCQENDMPFTTDEIYKAVFSQNDKKAPGEDGFSANIIKQLVTIVPEIITSLFNFCLQLGKFPSCFKISLIKIIPKANISIQTYKAWRPISLLSVPGKILEKLAINRIMFNLRSRKKLSEMQFGFTPHRSTIDAIKRVVNHIQKTLDDKVFSVVVSLDVEAAFDRASWPAILNRLRKLEIPSNLWYLMKDYFNQRSAKIELAGCMAIKNTSMGCPQGSTGGPSLWCVLYDEILLLDLPDNCELVGFADDLMLLCRANNIQLLEYITNLAIKTIINWSISVKLKFNEMKSRYMLCSRKRKPINIKLYMNQEELLEVNSIKYLGVEIDKKLNWRKHLNRISTKINMINNKLVSIARNSWGLKTDIVNTIYRGAIEPIILYAVDVWGTSLKFQWARNILIKMQRLFLLRICKGYRTISNDALTVIANIMPIDLKAMLNIQLKSTVNEGFMELNGNTIVVDCPEYILRHPTECYNNQIHINTEGIYKPQLKVYTDGSKMAEGTGCAYVLYQNEVEIYHQHFRLPDHCSIFQSELTAILSALNYVINAYPQSSTTIYSDSMSSLLALKNTESNDALIIKIQSLFKHQQNITLEWTKAHVGTAGNERADHLAKQFGSDSALFIDVNAPISFVKQQLKKHYNLKWNHRWQTSHTGSGTRRVFNSIDQRGNAKLFSPNFIVTQFISCHGKFGEYLYRFKCRQNSNCLCGDLQSRDHLIFYCSAFAAQRHRLNSLCNLANKKLDADHFVELFQFNPFIEFLYYIHKYLSSHEN